MLSSLTPAQRTALDGNNFNPGLRDGGLGAIIAALIAGQVEDSGRRAVNVLRLAANVVSAETVTIGSEVFEINIVNTDTTVNVSGGDLATGTPAMSSLTIAAHGLALGELIRVENEIMKVVGVVSANKVTVKRGHSGTTIATHADGTDIFKAGTAATGANIEVGLVTTLTPTAASAALVAVINSETTQRVTATAISVNEILLAANEPGAVVLACTETLSGANNGWADAAMFGGRAAGQRRIAIQRRVPTAVEVALGNMHFLFDFAPTAATVRANVIVTATPGVAKAWDGAVTVTGNRVTLDNAGTTDWAATDTVELIVTD